LTGDATSPPQGAEVVKHDAVLQIIASGASAGAQEMSAAEYHALLDAVAGDSPVPEVAATVGAGASEDITDEEFEQLLDTLHGKGKSPAAASAHAHATAAAMIHAAAASENISEEEFEQLLDTLHGKGKAPSAASASAPTATAAMIHAAAASEDITEEEFEQLLDSLHGKGKGPTVAGASEVAFAAPAPPPSPGPTPRTPRVRSPANAGSEGAGDGKGPGAPAASEVALTAPASPQQSPPMSKLRAPKVESTAIGDGEDAGNGKGSKNASATAPAAETTVRVETSVLDRIMNMVGELVLIRNRLATLQATAGNEEISKTVGALDVVTTELQMSAMKTRMQPIKKVFGRFPRVVRDLARQLKKEVSLELIGEDTDLDKNLVEALADPLVHLVRNSVDHGVEAPHVREAAGKPRTGTVMLAAEQEGDHILLTISDDGAGMDPEKLRAKAVEKGVMDADAAARLSDRDCFDLIFAPGFSTKTEISDVSGRGVGMDVVKTRIAQLNGIVSIDSRLGKGTTIQIKVPLTLAIMPTLMVTLGRQIFALPLVSVGEIIDFDLSKINRVDGQEVMVVRDKPLPFFYLSRWLVRGANGYAGSSGHVVIVTVGSQRIGLLVDQLIGQEEVVIKPLGAMLHGTKGLAGATITGDGRIALILDLPSLLDRYARRCA
jgi:two-component system chemotaxis sensor kinase CheA